MSKVQNCKYCQKRPAVKVFADTLDIYCTSPDHDCYPGAWVSGKNHEQVVDEWNMLHGNGETE